MLDINVGVGQLLWGNVGMEEDAMVEVLDQ
jgi:hypothetical protein